MDEQDRWPPVDEALVKALDAAIPDRCPDINDPDRAIWHYAGQRAVVELLWSIYREQQELR